MIKLDGARSLVRFKSDNSHKYKKNFLSKVVCEFKFPTLMELGESKPPASFVKSIRKNYPHSSLTNEVTIGPGAQDSNNTHIFRSQKSNWLISLKKSSFSIETENYTNHESMQERISFALSAALPVIDTEVFTRIGIRYINVIDSGEDPSDGWIADELVAPIKSKQFYGIKEFAGKIVSEAEDGGFTLQHKLRLSPPDRNDNPVPPTYIVDIDVFRNEVSVEEAMRAVSDMHSQAFDIFDWCAGTKLREYLSNN